MSIPTPPPADESVQGLDPWQRAEDGFPSDAYFEAVATALESTGIPLADWHREEDWEVTYELAPEAYMTGPKKWAEHGLYISWRCDEADEPRHADDFTGLGWYWVPYTESDTALGDFAEEFPLPYLAEPGEVAAAVARLVSA